MKAENILNSNFTSKNAICYKKKIIIFIFQNFRSSFDKKFFFELKFFKNFFYNPQKLFSPLVLNTKNGNYMKD